MTAKRFPCYLILLCLNFAPKAMAGMLIGTTTEAMYDIDPITGAASNPRPTSGPFDLTFVGDVLYGISNQTLFTLDLETGQAMQVGDLDLGSSLFGARDIAWDVANQRFLAIFQFGGVAGKTLYEINPVTLAAERIRLMDQEYTSLAFTDTGQLYAIDAFADVLGLIDTVDGNTLSVAALSVDIPTASIASDGGSGLYLMTRELDESSILSKLDPVTGAVSPVGSTGISDRSFNIAYIPEPASGLLLLPGLVLLIRRRVP